MTRWIRRLFGLALLGWSAWTLLRAAWRIVAGASSSTSPLYGIDADTGAPTGLRITPLDPLETTAARRLERDLWRQWIAPA